MEPILFFIYPNTAQLHWKGLSNMNQVEFKVFQNAQLVLGANTCLNICYMLHISAQEHWLHVGLNVTLSITVANQLGYI